MSNTTYTDSLEPVERLAEKVKSLIDVLERTQTELAETIDNGKPLNDSMKIDIPRAINNLKF